jgi:hypothetical protein
MNGHFFDLQLGTDFQTIEKKQSVTNIFRTILNLSDAEIRRIEEDKTRMLARKLSEEHAQECKELLEKAGAPCSIVPSLRIASLRREPPDGKKRAFEQPEPSLTACPACCTIQNQADVCIRCGTVLKEP